MDSNEFDFSSAIEQIQNMMNSDDGQAKLNNIINAFMGSENDNISAAGEGGAPFGSDNLGGFGDLNQMDMMIKLGSIMSSIKSQQTGRSAQLLYAIKPYLRESRQSKTDGAIKIMGMVKAFAAIKDSGINFDF